MKIEYLIILTQDDTFCNSKEAFIKFLNVDSKIDVSGNKIMFKSENNNSTILTIDFEIRTGEILSKKERYFHLLLTNNENNKIDEFNQLARTIKKIAEKINPDHTRINTLWNDVGIYYANQAYPYINQVENLMRKLISQFMLINVGMSWSKEAMDNELFGKIKEKSEDQHIHLDDLSKLDFIQLSEVLFQKYRTLGINGMDKILNNANQISDLDFTEIKKFQPQSNWERFFAKIVTYDEEKLKKQWKTLYELRNEIAHNRFINKGNFEKIKALSEELNSLITSALNKLGKISLKEEEKEIVIDSYLKDTQGFIRIGKVCAELNIGWRTIIEHLKKRGFNVDYNPNTKIPLELYYLLLEDFKPDKENKILSQKVNLSPAPNDIYIMNYPILEVTTKKENQPEDKP